VALVRWESRDDYAWDHWRRLSSTDCRCRSWRSACLPSWTWGWSLVHMAIVRSSSLALAVIVPITLGVASAYAQAQATAPKRATHRTARLCRGWNHDWWSCWYIVQQRVVKLAQIYVITSSKLGFGTHIVTIPTGVHDPARALILPDLTAEVVDHFSMHPPTAMPDAQKSRRRARAVGPPTASLFPPYRAHADLPRRFQSNEPTL